MTSFAIDVPQALIERLKRGDARAYEQLYRLFERPVYTLAWRMLGDADEAREILHDAMLVLIDKLDTFRGESPFWGWLRQIALNETLMRLRKRRIDYYDELPEPDASAHVPQAFPLEAADLERALGQLSPLTRSIVWMYFVEGFTHEEIAASFSRTVSFSKTQVSRGTRRMREALASTDTQQVAYG
jgi:RNA polymerase sigma-70 factor (ECF subfamily)